MSDEDTKQWEDSLRDKYGIPTAVAPGNFKEEFMDEFALAAERAADPDQMTFDEYLRYL